MTYRCVKNISKTMLASVRYPTGPIQDRLTSGSGTQLLDRRVFQTVKVAFAGHRLPKNMLCHFQPPRPTPAMAAAFAALRPLPSPLTDRPRPNRSSAIRSIDNSLGGIFLH